MKIVSKDFRALHNIFGARFNTYGERSVFPGSIENLRAHCYNLRGPVRDFGE